MVYRQDKRPKDINMSTRGSFAENQVNQWIQKSKKSKKLVLLGGYPGTGKSTIGKRLAQAMHAVWIDKDAATSLMTEHLLMSMQCNKDDRESDTYVQYVKPLEYATLLGISYDNLSVGHSIICTAPFSSQFCDHQWIDRTIDRAAEYDADLSLIWLTADAAVTRSRIINRGAGRDRWKLAYWENYLHALSVSTPSHNQIIHVENTVFNGIDDVISIILNALSR
jgi:predicted kinase